MGSVFIPLAALSNPENLVVEVTNPGLVSDGYHTMDELYEHRHMLFAALCRAVHPNQVQGWKSWRHADGSMFEGWFLAGLKLPAGQISYHFPATMWTTIHLPQYDLAPAFDGHTSPDVLVRLKCFADDGIGEEPTA